MVRGIDAALPRGHSLALVGKGGVDRLLSPVHRWVWADARRRAAKLLGFSATEADSGRDMARAAECTRDPLLRRLYLRHSMDESRHAKLFSTRGHAILAGLGNERGARFQADWLSPGERGLDDLDVSGQSDAALLAFLYLSERAGARRFVVYGNLLDADHETRAVFDRVLRDEAFHTNYSYAQLRRLAPGRYGWHILWARLTILWKAYLRTAAAIASVMGAVVLTVQYFVLLPVFALAAKRSASRERGGWLDSRPAGTLRSQY
jgi:hypothetical protein